MKITIQKHKNNSWTVQQADASAIGINYQEMICLVSALTMPEVRPLVHWMKTETERNQILMEEQLNP